MSLPSQRKREQERNALEEVIDTPKQKLYTLLVCNDWLNGPTHEVQPVTPNRKEIEMAGSLKGGEPTKKAAKKKAAPKKAAKKKAAKKK